MWDLPFTPLTSCNTAFATVTADVGSPIVHPHPGVSGRLKNLMIWPVVCFGSPSRMTHWMWASFHKTARRRCTHSACTHAWKQLNLTKLASFQSWWLWNMVSNRNCRWRLHFDASATKKPVPWGLLLCFSSITTFIASIVTLSNTIICSFAFCKVCKDILLLLINNNNNKYSCWSSACIVP